MAIGLNSRPLEWSRPPEPHPPNAGCWCSRNKRRPYVSLIWCSTPSGHGNGLRPWIRTNGRRIAHEPLNLTLDYEHAHVNGHLVLRPQPTAVAPIPDMKFQSVLLTRRPQHDPQGIC